MNSKMAYAIGILTLALGVGCTKRLPAPSLQDTPVELAAWVPEEMEGLVVFSSLEALNTALEQMKKSAPLKPLTEFLEAFEEEAKEEMGVDLFSLSTWQEMGLETRAPVMLGINAREGLMEWAAVPVVDQERLVAAIEKHWMSKEGREAQPDMPRGLHAWRLPSGNWMLLTQKPGHALMAMGDDLEVLQKRAKLPKEKSWAKHNEVLLKINSRLPANRVASVWFQLDKEKTEEVEWIGAAVTTQPRAKVVLDITWRQGEKPLLPKMQTVSFESGQWTQSLGDVMFGIWSSVTWEWAEQLFKLPFVSWDEEFQRWSTLKQHLEFPLLLRGRIQKAGESEAFRWSLDAVLKEESSLKQALEAFVPLMAEEAVEATQPHRGLPIWEAHSGRQKLWAHASGKNKARIADSLHSYERDAGLLQKTLMQEMTRYPMAVAIHLNALMKLPMARFWLGDFPEKAEYIVLGLRAEEDHAQLTMEHFEEADFR